MACRRGAALAVALLCCGLVLVPSAHAQCGETTNVPARVSVLPGPPPLAVGDSVLYDAAQPLAGLGFHVNAMVCRTMAQGIAYLDHRSASLPVLVVVALGTNGTVTEAQIDDLLQILGPTRGLALVTPKGGNDPSVPALYRSAARQHPGRILVLDWQRLSAGHPNWFAPDGIHLSEPGIRPFARLIASSLSALPGTSAAPLPPPSTTAPMPPTGTTPPQPHSSKPPAARHAVPGPSLGPADRQLLRRIFFYIQLSAEAVLTDTVSVLAG